MKIPLRVLISVTKKQLATCAPKHRDRIRRQLVILERANQIKSEVRQEKREKAA